MTRRPMLIFGIAVFCWSTAALPLRAQPAPAAGPATPARSVNWASVPVSFEPNVGQESPEVRYVARGNAYTLYLGDTEMLISGRNQPPLKIRLAGANATPRIAGEARQVSTSNYFVGNDPARWRTSVPNYERTRYEGVYPGIDLLYYGHDGTVEYDWIVSPSADPKRIRLRFDAADRLRIDRHGDLVVTIGKTEYRQRKPVMYQDVAGSRREVTGGWRVLGNEAGFRVGAYDREHPLTIDPPLYYSTYLGGSGDDHAEAIAVDRFGNTYVTGQTGSANFPTTSPLQGALRGAGDVFVTKLNADGSAKVYSTFLGSGGVDEGKGIAVNDRGEVYVTGSAGFSDFPVKNAIQGTWGQSGDAFLTKLDATGSSLVYSTYLGGNAVDYGTGIALDAAGNAYVVGVTNSTNFPTVAAFQNAKGALHDAFVAKINAAGSAWVYVTYLGGNAEDFGYGIAVDASSNAYVTGSTTSTNFPVQSPLRSSNGGAVDAFVAKLNPAGSALVYSTYLGGSLSDTGTAIAVDASGSAYVTGATNSDDFPLANPIDATLGSHAVDDVFVSKLSPSGSALVYSTYLGGGSGEEAYALTVDGTGDVFITGRTNSSDFPLVNAIQFTRFAFDLFVTEINPAGSALLFSTFLGGSGSESGLGIAVDSLGNIHVAGDTTSTDFPIGRALQTNNGGGLSDGLVLLLGTTVIQPATVSLSRQALTFAAATTATAFTSQTGPQLVAVTQTAGPAVLWTATSDAPWLVVSPASGSGTAALTVSVQSVSGLSASQTGTISIALTGASNSVGPITVTLKTLPASAAGVPFGFFDTPANGSTGLVGSIAVTGWALDHVGIDHVDLWRNCTAVDQAASACATAPDNSTQVYIGKATIVPGARPDVALAYPNEPANDQAGFGYLLLTNLLPDLGAGTQQGGNGQFVLSTYAVNVAGLVTPLGTKTITVDNAHATIPFGAIDTPAQGATIPGTSAPYTDPNSYPMFGWAMTETPKCMKTTDLTAYKVFIDGVSEPVNSSNFVAGLTRPDLPLAFPGLCNSNDALAAYFFNASALGLTSGIHTVMWQIRDDGGNVTNIGSRYFTLLTSSGQRVPSTQFGAASSLESRAFTAGVVTASVNGAPAVAAKPDAAGVSHVQLPMLGVLSLDLGGPVQRGYEVVGGQRHALPIGSTLDTAQGRFSWAPGVGFIGAFQLVFVSGDARTEVEVTIVDPAAASGTLLQVDTPQVNASVSRAFTMAGWALDPHAVSGSGIDAVHVWAYRRDVPSLPQFLGAATINGPRADVGQFFGAQFDHAAWSLAVSTLAPGIYDLVVYARSSRAQEWTATRTTTVSTR